jgi:hypothetical protein
VSQLDPEAKAKQKARRKKQAERLKETPPIKWMLNEEEMSQAISVSVRTLQNWRGETPERWTKERIAEEISKKGFIPPPFKKFGKDDRAPVRYDVELVNAWRKLIPCMGRLPEEEEGQ